MVAQLGDLNQTTTRNSLQKAQNTQQSTKDWLIYHARNELIAGKVVEVVGSSHVPFLMCSLETPQEIAAQGLALILLLSLLLNLTLKL